MGGPGIQIPLRDREGALAPAQGDIRLPCPMVVAAAAHQQSFLSAEALQVGDLPRGKLGVGTLYTVQLIFLHDGAQPGAEPGGMGVDVEMGQQGDPPAVVDGPGPWANVG